MGSLDSVLFLCSFINDFTHKKKTYCKNISNIFFYQKALRKIWTSSLTALLFSIISLALYSVTMLACTSFSTALIFGHKNNNYNVCHRRCLSARKVILIGISWTRSERATWKRTATDLFEVSASRSVGPWWLVWLQRRCCCNLCYRFECGKKADFCANWPWTRNDHDLAFYDIKWEVFRQRMVVFKEIGSTSQRKARERSRFFYTMKK